MSPISFVKGFVNIVSVNIISGIYTSLYMRFYDIILKILYQDLILAFYNFY